MVFLFPGTLAELLDASLPRLPHGHMLLPAPAAAARALSPVCSPAAGCGAGGLPLLSHPPPGKKRDCVKAAGCPAGICWKSHKLLRKASFPARQKVRALRESTGTVFINQGGYKESVLINIIIPFERGSPHLADTLQTKDGGCHSQP